jgi:ketosteroid isomerase-like protein
MLTEGCIMHILRMILALAVLVSVSVPGFSQQPARSAKEFLETWARSHVSGGPKASLKFFAETDDLIVIWSSGKQTIGFADFKKVVDDLGATTVYSEYNLSELRVLENKDTAWATFRVKAKFLDKTDNTNWQLDIRITMVLKRNKESWLIVLDHSSPIQDVPRLTEIKK